MLGINLLNFFKKAENFGKKNTENEDYSNTEKGLRRKQKNWAKP